MQKLQDLITAVGGDLIQHILVMAGIAAIMLSVDWRYALVVLGTIPMLFGIIQIYTRLLRQAIRQVRHYEGDLWSIAQEVLGGVQLVQAYGRERHEERRFADGARRIFQAGTDANELQAQFSPAHDARRRRLNRADRLVRRGAGTRRTYHRRRDAGVSRLFPLADGTDPPCRQDRAHRRARIRRD